MMLKVAKRKFSKGHFMKVPSDGQGPWCVKGKVVTMVETSWEGAAGGRELAVVSEGEGI